MQNPVVLVLVVYGVFTLIGGLIGYVKAKSLASLIAGTASGGILLACAGQYARGNRAALIVGASVAFLLGVRFVRTWCKMRRLMPDLLMVVLSMITIATIVRALVQAN